LRLLGGPEIEVDGEVEVVEKCRCLAVYLDSRLDWTCKTQQTVLLKEAWVLR